MLNDKKINLKKRERTCSRIIQAIFDCHGLLTIAATRAGVSYATINRYAAEYPSVQQAIQDAKESMLDFTEGKLFQAIREGDKTAILFYLKTQGKSRGYIEQASVEVTGKDGGPVQVESVRTILLGRLSRISTSRNSEGDNQLTDGQATPGAAVGLELLGEKGADPPSG